MIKTNFHSGSTMDERETFLRQKYQQRLIHEESDADAEQLNAEIFAAVGDDDLMSMIKLYVQGASLEWANPTEGGKRCLHAAVEHDHPMCVEWLLQNDAQLSAKDAR